CAAPSAKGDDKFITTDYLQQCQHNDDYLSAYAHNDTMLVREQQEVKAGQKIATMGSTGTSSTRLHFEIRYKGKSVNPLRYLPQR
ncbi:peptidoglycan DD-metalloendopeptidase family protein, partial [Salmonella enterica subsp. enterica serovar Corvallis]